MKDMILDFSGCSTHLDCVNYLKAQGAGDHDIGLILGMIESPDDEDDGPHEMTK